MSDEIFLRVATPEDGASFDCACPACGAALLCARPNPAYWLCVYLPHGGVACPGCGVQIGVCHECGEDGECYEWMEVVRK